MTDEQRQRIWEIENSCDGRTELAERIVGLEDLVRDLHCLCYPSTYEWEVADETYDKYSPCELCEESHGGKSPCASTSKDMSEECCKPFQARVVADRMREIGMELDG